MEYTFKILKYNVLDDGSTLYHIYTTTLNRPVNMQFWIKCENYLIYQYNKQIYYASLYYNYEILNDFYNIKPIKSNEEYNEFDITINGIIINRIITLYPYSSNPNTITHYIQNNQHLLYISEPYVLK